MLIPHFRACLQSIFNTRCYILDHKKHRLCPSLQQKVIFFKSEEVYLFWVAIFTCLLSACATHCHVSCSHKNNCRKSPIQMIQYKHPKSELTHEKATLCFSNKLQRIGLCPIYTWTVAHSDILSFIFRQCLLVCIYFQIVSAIVNFLCKFYYV